MKVYSETSLWDFNFWSGALDRVKYLTSKDFDALEPMVEEALADENGYIDETSINDLFWFEEDTIAQWLGYENFEELMEDKGE